MKTKNMYNQLLQHEEKLKKKQGALLEPPTQKCVLTSSSCFELFLFYDNLALILQINLVKVVGRSLSLPRIDHQIDQKTIVKTLPDPSSRLKRNSNRNKKKSEKQSN
jgi:hypothetical protein